MNNTQNHPITIVIIANSGKPGIFVSAGKQTLSPALPLGNNRLEPGEALSLERTGQTLQVVSGSAWITLDGQDMIVLAGQTMKLEPGTDAAVISALEDEPLVYHMMKESNLQELRS